MVKVEVEAITCPMGEQQDAIACFVATLDDGEGHVLDKVQVMPSYDKNGAVDEVSCGDGQDDLVLTYDESAKPEKRFYSEDTQEYFNADSVPFFYEKVDEETYALKEDIKDELRRAMDAAILNIFEGESETISSESIGEARAKKFLKEHPFVVAYNKLGRCADENGAWEFKTFQSKEKAKSFTDKWESEHRKNGDEFIAVYDQTDYERIADFLKYHNICGEKD